VTADAADLRAMRQSIERVAKLLNIDDPSHVSIGRWRQHKAPGYPGSGIVEKLGGWRTVKLALFGQSLRPGGQAAEPDVETGEPPKLGPEHDWDDSPTDREVVPFGAAGGLELGARRYVVTYAQNATGLHDDFWAALLQFADHRDAKILVVGGMYKNPTSPWEAQEDVGFRWWDPRVEPFRISGPVRLAAHLVVESTSIQPTAVTPLTGFEAFTGRATTIFGHPKIQLTCVATTERGAARILATTGACTLQNYSQSKAGAKGHKHHVFGAAYLEVDREERVFVRQINAEADGSFIDLEERFTPHGVEPAPAPLALVLGDVHLDVRDEPTENAYLWGDSGVAKTLRPAQVLAHDLLHFGRRSHHSRNDPDHRFDTYLNGMDPVEEEVDDAVAWLDRLHEETGADVVVVASNHDEAFDRWLREGDVRNDPANAKYFHRMRAAQLEAREREGHWVPAFELAYREKGRGQGVRFHERDEPLRIADIECSQHGDKGLNGARASLASFAKLGERVIVGHSHTPGIRDGAYQVGVVGAYDQGYNAGPSSWRHASALIYANGKRTLIFAVDGRWRA